MERLKKLHKGSDDHSKYFSGIKLPSTEDFCREDSKEPWEPQSAALLGYNGRLKHLSPLGFQPNELPYKSQTPIELRHDSRYQTDRKREHSRNIIPAGSFKKGLVVRPSPNDTAP